MGLLHRVAVSLWLSLQGEGPHWGTLSQLGVEVSGLTYSGGFKGPMMHVQLLPTPGLHFGETAGPAVP